MAEPQYLERLLWFDAEIRAGRFPNAARLAARFECSGKTGQRAVEYFRDRLGAPLAYDSVRRGYFYLQPDFHLPFARLTEREIIALLASRKLLSDAASGPIGEELGMVAAKLGALLCDNLTGTVNPETAFSFRRHGAAPGDPLVFHLVVDSLLHCRPLSFCYYSPAGGACTMRTVEPHHMVNYMGAWHVIAFCRLRGDWRDFHLSRITLCRKEEESFAPRPEPEWRPLLEDTFGIFQNREKFPVVLAFSAERARWVREQVWHPDQVMEEMEDGRLMLTLPVSHEAEITMEILRHGSHVEVREPEWLREKVRAEIGRMGEVYTNG